MGFRQAGCGNRATIQRTGQGFNRSKSHYPSGPSDVGRAPWKPERNQDIPALFATVCVSQFCVPSVPLDRLHGQAVVRYHPRPDSGDCEGISCLISQFGFSRYSGLLAALPPEVWEINFCQSGHRKGDMAGVRSGMGLAHLPDFPDTGDRLRDCGGISLHTRIHFRGL